MIVLDFDGTLVDVWRRYHKIFSEGLANPAATPSLEEYRVLKRKLKRDDDIACVLGTSLVPDYFECKAIKLEREEHLALDTSLLTEASEHIIMAYQLDFTILSARHNRDSLLWEIYTLGIPILPDHVHVVSPDDKGAKYRWLSKHKGSVEYIVGDSRVELQAAPEVDARRVFVDTGLFLYTDVKTDNGLNIQYSPSINAFLSGIVAIG